MARVLGSAVRTASGIKIVWTNLPEYFRGSERGMWPSDAVQSWVSSRHFAGRPTFNHRRTCGKRTPVFFQRSAL